MSTTDPSPRPTEKSCRLYRTDKSLMFPDAIVGWHDGTYSGEHGTHYRIVSAERIPLSESWGYRLATTDRPQSRAVELYLEEMETIDGQDWYSYYFRFIE